MNKLMDFKNGYIYSDGLKLRYKIGNIDSYICSNDELREIKIGSNKRLNQEIEIKKDKVIITNVSVGTKYNTLCNPFSFSFKTKFEKIWITPSIKLEMTSKQIATFTKILKVVNKKFMCPECKKRPKITNFKFNCSWCGLSGPTIKI